MFFLDIVNRQVGHAVKFIFKKVSIYPETIVVLSSHILWKGVFAFFVFRCLRQYNKI